MGINLIIQSLFFRTMTYQFHFNRNECKDISYVAKLVGGEI